jgi:hypothetical protein
MNSRRRPTRIAAGVLTNFSLTREVRNDPRRVIRSRQRLTLGYIKLEQQREPGRVQAAGDQYENIRLPALPPTNCLCTLPMVGPRRNVQPAR